MSNVLSGNIVQQPNRVEVPTTVRQNQIDVPLTAPKDAYQLAKLLDPTIGSLEEWIASLYGDPSSCLGVYPSVEALMVAWPDGPGLDHLNYWAFAVDASDATILWLYRPDPLNEGSWVSEQINLPVTPLSTDDTLGGENPSDEVAPSQAAVKSYVDTAVGDVTPESIGAQPAGSYATLDEGGKVPSTQLPSYVDDVLEVSDYAHLPGTGEVGKIYVTLDTNKTYRWGGSAYFEISASPGSTDAVPEGSVNKYYTDARASAAAPVQKVNNKTGDVSLTYSDVGAAPSSHNHDDRYYTEGETDTLLAGKSNTGHTHDDRYYTESETDTFLDFLRLHLTSGIVSGGVLSINADPTKYNISAGVGYVVNYWSNPGTPTVVKVEWAAQTGLTSAYLNSSISTTIMINAAGAVVTQTDAPSRNNYSEYIVLGKLLHPNRTTVTGISHYHHSISGSIGNAMDMMHFLGTMANGVNFTPNGANLHLDRSSGSLLRIGGNYTTNKEAPNRTDLLAQTPASFFYRYRDGSGGFKIDTPAVTTFNPDVYDDGSGTLATVNNNKFVNHRVYVFTSGNAYIVPGQTQYQNLNAAVSALATEEFSVDPQLADANLRCVITAKKGVTSLLSTDVNFTQGGTFGVLGGAAGGGGTTSPGGSAYDLQYNNNGNFGGTAITGLVKARGAEGAPVAATPDVDFATPASVSALAGQVTLASVQGVMAAVGESSTIEDTDVVWMAPAAKTPGKWVPWLTGIVNNLKNSFIHLLGGQTIQSSAADVVTITTKGAAGQIANLIEAKNSDGTQLFYVAANGTVSSSGTIMATTGFQVAGTKAYTWDSRGVMSAPSDGVILLQNWATTDFSRLQFGGTTSLFPALKRVLAGLAVRTADDSADGSLTVGNSFVNGMLTVLGNFTGNGTDNQLPNQIAGDLSSIVTRRTAAGLSGYHMHRQCAVNGSWYAGYNRLGGGFSASGPQLQVYNSTTLGSRSFPCTLQFDLAPLGATSGNGYSSIDWNMSEIWMEFVFKLSWAINSSNVRKNQVLRMGFGNMTADCIGAAYGCVGFHVSNGASETNYDIRVFNAIGVTASKAPISGATFATPIVVTQNYHAYATGDLIEIDGCVGNTAANGIWTVTRLTAHTYSLDGSVGNGTWTSGGASHRITDVLLNTTALNNKKVSLRLHKIGGMWNFYMNDNLLVSIPHVSPTVMGFGIMGMLAKTMVGGTGTTNMYVYEVNYGCEP